MRNFESGATRNDDSNELDFEGFLSPIVLKRFAEHMHKNRFQADGKIRSGDNWQKGISIDSYAKSLIRHTMDFWLNHRGYKGREDIETALSAIIFNAQGYLYELLKQYDKKETV